LIHGIFFLSFIHLVNKEKVILLIRFWKCTPKRLLEKNNLSLLEDQCKSKTVTIDLFEQLHMIQLVRKYLEEFEKDNLPPIGSHSLEYTISNEIHLTQIKGDIFRSQLEVCLKNSASGAREASYIFRFIKLVEDRWRIFEVKKVAH
jgi:hypothetical protein